MCRLSLGNDFHPMTGNLRRKFENNDETLKYVAILRGSPWPPPGQELSFMPPSELSTAILVWNL